MEQEHVALLEAYEKVCAFSARLAQTLALLCAVDDLDLTERASLLAKQIIRLTFPEGFTSVRIERQEDLADLTGIGKGKIAPELYELTRANVLQIHPDTKDYEILPNVAQWKARPRCRLGSEHALALAINIAQEERRRRSEQIDMGEVESSFQPEPTLRQVIGQNARDEATASHAGTSLESSDHASSRPGADEETQLPNPPGIIGTEKPAGSRRQSEAAPQVIGPAPKVTFKETFDPGQDGAGQPKVPFKVTFGEMKAVLSGQKLPKRELSSRARASDHPDDPVICNHLVNQSSQLSSDDPDHPDERSGAGKKQMMVRLDDELLGDIERALGGMAANYVLFWREAIAASRRAAAHALEAIKFAKREYPGGYMRTAFYNECDQLGIKLPDALEHRRPPRKGPRGGKR